MIRILDTHLHLVYPERFSYPWIANAPHLQKRFPVEDYFAEAEALGIQSALHMEVDVAEPQMREETDFVLAYEKATALPPTGDRPLVETALTYDTGDPAILAGPLGSGRVVLLTTSLDTTWAGPWPQVVRRRAPTTAAFL